MRRLRRRLALPAPHLGQPPLPPHRPGLLSVLLSATETTSGDFSLQKQHVWGCVGLLAFVFGSLAGLGFEWAVDR